MFADSIKENIQVAVRKMGLLQANPFGYLVSSMLAGVYVGFAIMLVFIIGGPFAAANNPAVKLVMGASFGLALTLVVFAGSELFTGNVMYMSFAIARREARFTALLKLWLICWSGNLLGAMLLSLVLTTSGTIDGCADFVHQAASLKTTAGAWPLVGRGILCNMLVCLSLWTSYRTRSDTAKLVLIWWCLFAFIGSGLEHSVANMTLLTLSIFKGGVDAITWAACGYNLLWVSLGNIVGGVLLAAAYLHISRTQFLNEAKRNRDC